MDLGLDDDGQESEELIEFGYSSRLDRGIESYMINDREDVHQPQQQQQQQRKPMTTEDVLQSSFSTESHNNRNISNETSTVSSNSSSNSIQVMDYSGVLTNEDVCLSEHPYYDPEANEMKQYYVVTESLDYLTRIGLKQDELNIASRTRRIDFHPLDEDSSTNSSSDLQSHRPTANHSHVTSPSSSSHSNQQATSPLQESLRPVWFERDGPSSSSSRPPPELVYHNTFMPSPSLATKEYRWYDNDPSAKRHAAKRRWIYGPNRTDEDTSGNSSSSGVRASSSTQPAQNEGALSSDKEPAQERNETNNKGVKKRPRKKLDYTVFRWSLK